VGYNKIIVSGNHLEIYSYEKNLSIYRRERKPVKARPTVSVLVSNGPDTLSPGQLGKRRDNARRATVAFARLVRSNLDGNEPPILVTLTYAKNETSLRTGYSDFGAFIQALRYRFGKGFKYIACPEFQKRGAVHFHALFWGISSSLVLSERKTRLFGQLWGRGFVDLYLTDGSEKMSSYLAKYMAKAYLDPRLKGQKDYIASRNIKRPIVMSDISPLWPVMDDYGLSTDTPLHEKHFNTYWLGKGRYRAYQLKP